MKKLIFLFFIIIISCKNNQETEAEVTLNDSIKKETTFEMYKMSEQAMLMEQMYSYNLHLRSQILNNDSLGVFPSIFNNIHTAVMTNESDNDAFFHEQALIFIDAQKAIYVNPSKAKDNYNKMVQSCLDC